MHPYIKNATEFCRRNQKVILAVALALVILIALYLMTRPVNGFTGSMNKPEPEPFTSSGNTASVDDIEYTTGPVEWDADKEVAIVFHRMPGCGPCKAFTPVWQKVAAGLRGKKDKSGRTVRLFVVDQTHPLSKDVGVFPIVRKHVSREEHREFNGPRTEENLSSFIIGA